MLLSQTCGCCIENIPHSKSNAKWGQDKTLKCMKNEEVVSEYSEDSFDYLKGRLESQHDLGTFGFSDLWKIRLDVGSMRARVCERHLVSIRYKDWPQRLNASTDICKNLFICSSSVSIRFKVSPIFRFSILSTVTLPIHPPSETFHAKSNLTSFGHFWKLNTVILSTTYTQSILPTHGLITGKLQRGRRSETQLLHDKSATQSSLSFCVEYRSGTLRNSPPLSFLQGHLFSFSMFPPLKTSPLCVLIYDFFSTAL